MIRMKKVFDNYYTLFKVILLSYLFPESKKKFRQKIQDVYLPNIMKCIAVSCLLLTILTWMGINSGLKDAYRAFKQDPYTTAVFVTSNRFKLNKDQVERIEITRYDIGKKEFNTEGTGEEIYGDAPFAFSSLDLTFYAQDGKERKSFRGRTVSRTDKKMLRAIAKHISYKSSPGYELERDWKDNERGIVVSKHLLDRLGYKIGKTKTINRCIDKRFQGKNHSFPVTVTIIAAAESLPFGDFIVSEEFDYNRLQNTFNPFDTVERFYVFTPAGKEPDLENFINSNFSCVEKIVLIDRDKDNQTRYEIAFKSIPQYREEFKKLRQESSKYFIARQFENSPFRCDIDYYDWKPLPEEKNSRDPEYLALYLKERYIDRLDRLSLFFRETVGGIEMDDTVMNIFENYHKDMRRFKRISIILYTVLVGLGIFVSIAITIKSVQATMHRLGVFSTFGVSASFLSLALAVESMVNFGISLVIGLISYFFLSPLLLSKEITMKLEIMNLFVLFLAGMLLSFLVAFLTVKSMLKKAPYSLMDYRS
jgi:hypothetical protein